VERCPFKVLVLTERAFIETVRRALKPSEAVFFADVWDTVVFGSVFFADVFFTASFGAVLEVAAFFDAAFGADVLAVVDLVAIGFTALFALGSTDAVLFVVVFLATTVLEA